MSKEYIDFMPHIHELIDFTVGAYIVFQHKVLLVDHKKLKMWMPIGGHIELNEHPIQAIIREIQEECGLTVELIGSNVPPAPMLEGGVEPLLAPMYMDIHDISETHRHVGLVYFAKATTDTVKLAEQEHNSIRWFTKEELEDPANNVYPYVRFYATKALTAR